MEGVVLDPSESSAPREDQEAAPGEGTEDSVMDEEGRPSFKPASAAELRASASASSRLGQGRKIPIPPHRWTPLQRDWRELQPLLTGHLGLQVLVHPRRRTVFIRTSTKSGEGSSSANGAGDAGAALQKGEDLLRAYAMGFEVGDAAAVVRLDDVYIETFEIRDVRTRLDGDHLSRAIGRIAGKDGKTKFAIENVSKTRIVLADSKVHILGRFKDVRIAQESIVSLILGKPPGKVYNGLNAVARRRKEMF